LTEKLFLIGIRSEEEKFPSKRRFVEEKNV